MSSRIILMMVLGFWATPCSQEGQKPSHSEAQTSQFQLSLQDTDHSMARIRIYRLTNDQLSITVGRLQHDQDELVFRHEFDGEEKARVARLLDSIDFEGLKERYSNDCMDDGSQILLHFRRDTLERSVHLSNYYLDEVARIVEFENSIAPKHLEIWYNRERLLKAFERCKKRRAGPSQFARQGPRRQLQWCKFRSRILQVSEQGTGGMSRSPLPRWP